ncbi:MAG: FAD binding domain-containing protein, partial [Bacilli bacterium]
MLDIKEYYLVENLQEAYDLIQGDQKACIVGGGMWLRLQNRFISKAIDLSRLELNQIKEVDNYFEIGAMVTLSDLINNQAMRDVYDNAFFKSLEGIVGYQFRNMATIGGSVFGRYGFSDVISILVALNAKVVLHNQGEVPLVEFAKQGYTKDILVSVLLPKKQAKVSYQRIV